MLRGIARNTRTKHKPAAGCAAQQDGGIIMNKREAERRTMMNDTLRSLGFTRDECEALRRISMTLHRWHDLECGIDGGCIERDEITGKAYWLNSHNMRRSPIADRETGALKRLASVIAARNWRCAEQVHTYVQTDPRGAALYILRPGDVPEGQTADCCYSRGICVY